MGGLPGLRLGQRMDNRGRRRRLSVWPAPGWPRAGLARQFSSRLEAVVRLIRASRGISLVTGFSVTPMRVPSAARRQRNSPLRIESAGDKIQTLMYAGLGDKDPSIEALDRMASAGHQLVGWYLTFPELALLRGDPRLRVIRRKAGLPEKGLGAGEAPRLGPGTIQQTSQALPPNLQPAPV